MPSYSIHASCYHCGEIHQTGILIELHKGSVDTLSVADTYQGGIMPPTLEALLGEVFQCPSTNLEFIQEDHSQVFLVPIVGKV